MSWTELIVGAVLGGFILLMVLGLVGFVWQLFAGSRPHRRRR